jgi:hypothetical protein
MVPRIVLKTFPDVKLLSVHAMAPEFSTAPTVFVRRKGPISPKVSALIEVLMKQRDLKDRRPTDKRDNAVQARANGRSRSDRVRKPSEIERSPPPQYRLP